jgi:hypothetical protein
MSGGWLISLAIGTTFVLIFVVVFFSVGAAAAGVVTSLASVAGAALLAFLRRRGVISGGWQPEDHDALFDLDRRKEEKAQDADSDLQAG